jgi:hypothetical protein
MPRLVHLDEDQFNATFVDPMQRLGEDADFVAIPLGDYVTECIADLDLAATLDDREIRHVYINGDKTFCHVMLYSGEPNRYLVIVTDNGKKTIHGHHVLDLNEKYGITNTE